MTLEEAAKQFRMPLEHLEKIRGEGLLSDPLALDEINNLSFLRYFWRKPRWLKMQMSKMNHKARLALIRTADLSKVESYVFNRYYNAAPGERHRVESIAGELNYYCIAVSLSLERSSKRSTPSGVRRRTPDTMRRGSLLENKRIECS